MDKVIKELTLLTGKPDSIKERSVWNIVMKIVRSLYSWLSKKEAPGLYLSSTLINLKALKTKLNALQPQSEHPTVVVVIPSAPPFPVAVAVAVDADTKGNGKKPTRG